MAITISEFLGTVQKTDSHTLELTDAYQTVEISKATAVNLTVPPNSDVAFPIGTRIFLKRTGAGAMTVVQGSGVTVTGSSGGLTDAGLNVEMYLRKTGTNTWSLQNGVPALTWTSHAPTVTGFTGTPTLTGDYIEDGKLIIYRFTISGTSNANTFTITNLPFNAAKVSHHILRVSDNAVAAVGFATTAVGSAVLTIAPTVAGTATGWTTSGNKGALCTIIYERQ